MTKRERIKDMLAYVEEHIENANEGYDVDDTSFIIKYKSGELVFITGYDIPNKFSRDVSKIDYIVANCGDDSWDSENRTWLRDFVVNGEYTNESLDAWNEYVNQMLYGDS